MLDLNKSHTGVFRVRGIWLAQIVLITVVLMQSAFLSAQQTSLRSAPIAEDFPEAPAVAKVFGDPRPSAAGTLESPAIRPAGAITPVALVAVPTLATNPEAHPFWDGRNRALFAANGAMATADFFVTRRNLAHSGVELNPITRIFSHSTPALAANFAGETAGVIGVSYFFHKTGHHKLERLTSCVNLSASAFAVSYGLAHR